MRLFVKMIDLSRGYLGDTALKTAGFKRGDVNCAAILSYEWG